jgi:hypothetical protein
VTQRNVTIMIDDLTGKELPAGTGETVSFTLDGVGYEIDVNEKDAARLRSLFARYINAGRRTSTRGARRYRRTRTGSDPSTVRAWAAANGIHVSDRGRIPSSVTAQFEAAGN